jgi:hypothetical protein
VRLHAPKGTLLTRRRPRASKNRIKLQPTSTYMILDVFLIDNCFFSLSPILPEWHYPLNMIRDSILFPNMLVRKLPLVN